jgi:hypothetical protein
LIGETVDNPPALADVLVIALIPIHRIDVIAETVLKKPAGY